ncbi:MAG: transposase [Planctomycetes bacterium]|nr:transposase [Planctomycetota bacterium]
MKLNDHDDLRHDPLLAVLVGRKDPLGSRRRSRKDRGKALAGKSTLNRLELTPVRASDVSRYKKITMDRRAVQRLFNRRVHSIVRHAAETHRAGPGRHGRRHSRSPVRPILSRLLQELLLPAVVYLLRRAPAVRAIASLKH